MSSTSSINRAPLREAVTHVGAVRPVAAASPPSPEEGDAHARAQTSDDEPAKESPFARVLARLGDAATRGEASADHAARVTARGGDLSASELLALQTGVYRYSEVIDLSSKLVDRASTGVKTVVQGQ